MGHTETIYLKDGSKIQGFVKNANEQSMDFETQHGLLTIKKEDIERIDYSKESTENLPEEPHIPLPIEQPSENKKIEVSNTERQVDKQWALTTGLGFHSWPDSSFFSNDKPLGPWFDPVDFSGGAWNLGIGHLFAQNEWTSEFEIGSYEQRVTSTLQSNPTTVIYDKVIEDLQLSVFRVLATVQKNVGSENQWRFGGGFGVYKWKMDDTETNIDTLGVYRTLILNMKGDGTEFALHLKGSVDLSLGEYWFLRFQDTYSFGPLVDITAVFPTASIKLGTLNFGGNILAANIGYRFD